MREGSKHIHLHIGEFIFGRGSSKINTLLGSCVAVIFFHPYKRYSAMCHFALPRVLGNENEFELNPRYGADCFYLFEINARRKKLDVSEFDCHIIGGGNMMKDRKNYYDRSNTKSNVGEKNAIFALQAAQKMSLNVQTVDVGEFGYRKVSFDSVSGDVKSRLFANTTTR